MTHQQLIGAFEALSVSSMSGDALQEFLLRSVANVEKVDDTRALRDAGGHPLDQALVLTALQSLSAREMISFETHEQDQWILTEEGAEIASSGSHEAKVFYAIPEGPTGISIPELSAKLGETAKIGQGKALKNKWIQKEGPNFIRATDKIVDQAQIDLVQVRDTRTHSDEVLKDLKRRKLVDKSKLFSYSYRKGLHFALTVEKAVTDLTVEMIQSGVWKTQKFKKFNLDADGVAPRSGHLHPLMKVREEFRRIFFEMGFVEMPTNNFVENSFWNFDALFQPQQHPARDAHDTFFLTTPSTTLTLPDEYVEKVKQVHENGGYGSIGYRYDWSLDETKKNLLRTHTTAVSSRMLYQLAQEKEFQPVKYFSIDRVFRNESVDATHLAEFHQIEGLIADYDLTLGDLIGVLYDFFTKLGMTKLRFKPAYNPYTEPSMEIFAFHEGLKKWIEIGNSGVFRPEMLQPMGLDPRVSVIAWGLSLERPTMIKYGISNIRDLVGHKVDLIMVQNNPICRIDK